MTYVLLAPVCHAPVKSQWRSGARYVCATAEIAYSENSLAQGRRFRAPLRLHSTSWVLSNGDRCDSRDDIFCMRHIKPRESRSRQSQGVADDKAYKLYRRGRGWLAVPDQNASDKAA